MTRKKLTPITRTVTQVTPLAGGAGTVTERERAELATLKALDIGAFSEMAEQLFVRLTLEIITDEGGAVAVRDVLANAAYEIGISTETAKRYLLKYTARRAPLAMAGGKVTAREVTK